MPVLDTYPMGVRLPLLDCIHRCCEALPSCWPTEAYQLIGRHDITMTRNPTNAMTTPTVDIQRSKDGMNLDLEVCV